MDVIFHDDSDDEFDPKAVPLEDLENLWADLTLPAVDIHAESAPPMEDILQRDILVKGSECEPTFEKKHSTASCRVQMPSFTPTKLTDAHANGPAPHRAVQMTDIQGILGSGPEAWDTLDAWTREDCETWDGDVISPENLYESIMRDPKAAGTF